MYATQQELIERLERLHIDTDTFDHPAVYTVEEAKTLRGTLPGSHSKNLFLKDKKNRFWLIVTLADKDIDLKVLGKIIGAAPLSFGKKNALVDKLGVQPGSVTPFSIINATTLSVTVVLDEDLLKVEPLNFHPLVNTSTTQISKTGLLTFIRDCKHEPMILAL